MRNLVLVCMVSSLVGFAARAVAQDPPEKSRTFCDVNDAKNKCPGAQCVCTPDTMEVVFDRDGTEDSVFAYPTFVADTAVDTTIMMDVKTNGPDPGDGVQGWSYGVDHDDAFLTLSGVTVEGTSAAPAISGGFVVADMVDIETCVAEAPPACKNPQPGTGYISAIILSFTKPAELATGRGSLAKAKYTLKADPGTTGTIVNITDRLKKKNSPPTDINITINGVSKSPETMIDGFVVKEGGGVCVPTGNEDLATGNSCTDGLDNDCDNAIDAADSGCACVSTPEDLATGNSCTDGLDNDCDGKTDGADEGCVAQGNCDDYAFYFGPAATTTTLAVAGGTEYVITGRNAAAALGFQLGVKATTAAGTTTWDFAGTLGTDANRLIELIITDDQGNSKTPVHPNKATSTTALASDIKRGAAIAGFNAKDFFAFDLAPGVGGPGYTVGYVADTNPTGAGNKIPLTGAAVGAVCPVNELLKVTLGGVVSPNFSRGDANGDSKINVTDAVLIIQIVVGNLTAKFTCQDILDANDDGAVNVSDAIPVLAYVFQKGPNLAAPFRACAADPTNDTLACTQSNCQ